jgi:hypothetical protein
MVQRYFNYDMELPSNLKNLYRHWGNYITLRQDLIPYNQIVKDERFWQDIIWFINERIYIWEKKITNEQSPYTADPILSAYRFCNIFREFDRQTIEFHTLLNLLRDDFPLWLLNMFYCRMIARPQTVRDLGLLSFNDQDNKLLYEKLIKYPRPRYGTPYVFPISTILKSKTPTRELLITEYLPQVMKVVAEEISTWNKISVYEGVQKIIPIFGYNLHFLWTEVLIDVAYQFPEYIDLFGRFPIGPGSLPTLQRISSEKDPSVLVIELAKINVNIGLTYNNKPLRLSAENWEGIGCEFRKYTNLKQGKGRKRKYIQIKEMNFR